MPNAPTGVTVVADYSSIGVSWDPPIDNGVEITGYRAIASPGPATCETTDATECVLGGEAGTAYTVTVVALSAGGESAASAPSRVVSPLVPVVASEPPDTNLPLDHGGNLTTVTPGESLILFGDGFAPYSTVTLIVYSTPIVMATATAEEDGSFRQTVTVPTTLSAGRHSFVAAGVDADGNSRLLRLDITVSAGGSGGGNLPVTGPAGLWLLVIGFGMTMAGVALRQACRR